MSKSPPQRIGDIGERTLHGKREIVETYKRSGTFEEVRKTLNLSNRRKETGLKQHGVGGTLEEKQGIGGTLEEKQGIVSVVSAGRTHQGVQDFVTDGHL